jgi:transcription antitermination factor NusG
MAESNKKWYALYTKPRWEKKVDKALSKKALERIVL